MGKRVKILRETLKIAQEGTYLCEEKEVSLPFDFEQIQETKLYLPEQIRELMEQPLEECLKETKRYMPEKIRELMEQSQDDSFKIPKSHVRLSNQDTLEAAFKLNKKREKQEKPVLILNFANPHRPGGGIRQKPGTQEEHLCVKTTVLCSLETEEAWPFYQRNLDCGTQAQTDAILFSPNTVVIRNPDLSLREDPFQVGVMTVSAPMAKRMEEEELPGLEEILLRRIRGMLRAALAEGYSRIVLGAWGCGNFGNDHALVAKLFYKALQEPIQPGSKARIRHYFAEVAMAVLDRSEELECYRSFAKYFREESNVEFFRQHTRETCGISSVLMLLDRYGKVKYPRPKQEKKLYDLYRTQAFKGVQGSAAAECLAKNGLEVALIHSSEHLLDNRDGYFEQELFGNMLEEYKLRLENCRDRITLQTGVDFDCEDLKTFLKNGKQVMLQCIVDGDADGIHDRVLHWIVLYGWDGEEFLTCDPDSYKRRFTDEELTGYMDTPIGKICIVVGEKA